MRPLGLTFKHEGFGKVGELMLIHLCLLCGKIHINRIARDDPEQSILHTFRDSFVLEDNIKKRLNSQGVYLLDEYDTEHVNIQLFGG
jgi:hypothetical protein